MTKMWGGRCGRKNGQTWIWYVLGQCVVSSVSWRPSLALYLIFWPLVYIITKWWTEHHIRNSALLNSRCKVLKGSSHNGCTGFIHWSLHWISALGKQYLIGMLLTVPDWGTVSREKPAVLLDFVQMRGGGLHKFFATFSRDAFGGEKESFSSKMPVI